MIKSILIGTLSVLVMSTAFADSSALPDAVKTLHNALAQNDCQSDLLDQTQSYDLGKGYKLTIVPCIMGAYQGSSRVYISKDGSSVQPVVVLESLDGISAADQSIVGTMELTEADYDPATKTLSTFAKGRGIGDCGQSSKSIISIEDYMATVKTVEIRSKSKCDGKMSDWPVIFKQK